MHRVKILGAGSIGNHLSHAARRLGWEVCLCDVDDAALERTRTSIYPTRYGAWDEAIDLCRVKDAPTSGHDLIFIGTPPDSHLDLAIAAIEEEPRAILIEKPLCGPGLERAQEFVDLAGKHGVAAFVGYDHIVGGSCRKVDGLVAEGDLGRIETIDVEFREHWGGIFAAHPWLDGPGDTYLGYWRRGGGASGEHSHAINLWQHFARLVGAGRVVEVGAILDYVKDGAVEYDKLCALHLKTETGLVGRVVQDVVTAPARKWARLQARNGYVEWRCGYRPDCDVVITGLGSGEPVEHLFHKTRPDDFIEELRHIDAALAGDPAVSPIALSHGLDTMLVVAAAHISAQEKRVVAIDYGVGYTPSALTVA